MTESEPGDQGPTAADLAAAVEEASRNLGVPRETPVERKSGGPPPRSSRPAWVVVALLVAGIVTALALRGADFRDQPTHRVEADLRWAVARVVEYVERERRLRGRLPAEADLRVLLGETLSYSVQEGDYRVVGRRAGVRVEYDGSLPLEEWRALILHPPGTSSR